MLSLLLGLISPESRNRHEQEDKWFIWTVDLREQEWGIENLKAETEGKTVQRVVIKLVTLLWAPGAQSS